MDDKADCAPHPKAEAVCFTAGLTGILFGAGVIHAYLAAGREPPRIVAGVSGGVPWKGWQETMLRTTAARACGSSWRVARSAVSSGMPARWLSLCP